MDEARKARQRERHEANDAATERIKQGWLRLDLILDVVQRAWQGKVPDPRKTVVAAVVEAVQAGDIPLYVDDACTIRAELPAAKPLSHTAKLQDVQRWFALNSRWPLGELNCPSLLNAKWPPYPAPSEPRQIAGRKLWSLSEAVEAIAEMPNFGVLPDVLLKMARRAATEGNLTTRDPDGGAPRPRGRLTEFLVAWVFDEDFNAWLEAAGYSEPYRLAATSFDVAGWNTVKGSASGDAMDESEYKARRTARLARLAELQRAGGPPPPTPVKAEPAARPVPSNAPAPLEPLRGGGPIDRPKAQPIRWPAWRVRPDVELWQAVALSLRILPSEPMRNEMKRGPSRHSRLPPEFFERLDLCQQCVRMAGPIRPQGPLYAGMLQDPRCLVLLAEVADVLAGAGFGLPEELRALVLEPAKPEAQAAAPVARAPAAAESVPAVAVGTTKRWTPKRLEELRAYRVRHGTKKAAEHFGVSASRVRELLPTDKPAPMGYSAFNPHRK